MTLPVLDVVRLPGLTDYATAWALQRAVHAKVSEGDANDTMLLLEHPRTITMGRRGGWDNLVTPAQTLVKRGFQLWQIDRGGDITYHGPGQLVGYPIINLRRAELELGPYLRNMEQAHIDLAARYEVAAERVHGFTGVWCGLDKITAIGVRVTRWTSMHGFALNVTTELEDFDHIVACGLNGRGVTSLEKKTSQVVEMGTVESRLADAFAANQGFAVRWIDPDDLPAISADVVAALHKDWLYTGSPDEQSVATPSLTTHL